jgi:hypothetical protein
MRMVSRRLGERDLAWVHGVIYGAAVALAVHPTPRTFAVMISAYVAEFFWLRQRRRADELPGDVFLEWRPVDGIAQLTDEPGGGDNQLIVPLYGGPN